MIRIELKLSDTETNAGIESDFFLENKAQNDIDSILKEIYHCSIKKLVNEDIELGIASNGYKREHEN